jgi:hypothetical protein
VVGAGAAAVHAAQTLTDQGHRCTILDVGIGAHRSYASEIPEGSFDHLHSADARQHRYFLGTDFEALAWGKTSVGAQLTPSRRFVVDRVGELIPKTSQEFEPYESLAFGGLGGAWGAGGFCFSPAELEACGLHAEEMNKSYQTVIGRIGISRPGDDIAPYTVGENRSSLEPSICQNTMFRELEARYTSKKEYFRKRGFYMGKPSLAVLGEDRPGRRAHAYQEMEFYSDRGKSVYRPAWTLEDLISSSKVTYLDGSLVTHFQDLEDGALLNGVRVSSREPFTLKAKRVILAAGVLGTARIVLRSVTPNGETIPLPLLCNSYSYYPSLFGWKKLRPDSHGFALAQFLMFHDEDGTHRDVAMASVYGYRSLLLFRLIREVPLPFPAARVLMRWLQPRLLIFGIHHPDWGDGVRSLTLVKSANSLMGDQLSIRFRPNLHGQAARERKFKQAIRGLGCLPIKRVDPGFGSSIHYAGTLPYSDEEKPWRLSPTGRLYGQRHIYVADGSGLNFLPAKGITLTLMALGDLTARHVSKELRGIRGR